MPSAQVMAPVPLLTAASPPTSCFLAGVLLAALVDVVLAVLAGVVRTGPPGEVLGRGNGH